jgi:hypothetical protein
VQVERRCGEDSLAIMALSQLCPQRNGNVVFQARSLYSLIFNDMEIPNDDSCIDADTSYIAERHNHASQGLGALGEKQSYKVYPNPNDGNFVMQQGIQDNEPVRVKIYDALGRNVHKDEVQFENLKSKLNLNNLSPGMYVLEIADSKNRIFRYKFVVQ